MTGARRAVLAQVGKQPVATELHGFAKQMPSRGLRRGKVARPQIPDAGAASTIVEHKLFEAIPSYHYGAGRVGNFANSVPCTDIGS
jgi:hypothetical protein